MTEVLFVCTGNTCRSPMAEIIANDSFLHRSISAKAFSRGINVMVVSRASRNALQAVKLDYGLDLSNHMARQLTEKDLERASLVLTMTSEHKNYIEISYPAFKEKTFSLMEYCHGNIEIWDPYGSDLFKYKKCAKQLKDYIDTIVLD